MRPLRSLAPLAFPLLLTSAGACGGDDLVLPSETPGAIEIVEGNGQEGETGTALPDPLIIRLVDDAGSGVPNRTVVWVVDAGSGAVDPATGMTDAEGFASAEWTLGPSPGIQRVTAQVPGIGSTTFTATNTDDGNGGEPSPASVEALEGNGQSAEAGTEVAIRPAVRVLDDDGQPVAGFEVTFAVTGGGGSVSGASPTTDAQGIARIGRWTLGETPGTNTLEARAGSLAGSPVVFTAEGTQPEPEPEADVDRLVFLVPPRAARENETFQVQVALVDANGGVVPLSGIFIYVALFEEGKDNPINGLLRGERFENTEDGVATFDLAVGRAGRYRLRALTDDLPELGPHGPEPWLYSEVFEIRD
jgi:adhesin/invasin